MDINNLYLNDWTLNRLLHNLGDYIRYNWSTKALLLAKLLIPLKLTLIKFITNKTLIVTL